MISSTRAVIYIPPDLPNDSPHAKDCLAHLERRHYDLFAILREWDSVVFALNSGKATTVIIAREEHAELITPGTMAAVPVEIVGDLTRRLVFRESAAQTPASPAPRFDVRRVVAALFVATIGAGLLWVGLQRVDLAVEWPLYLIIDVVLAAWVPMLGLGVHLAWGGDIARAFALGFNLGHRDGYADGYVDCATVRQTDP